MKTRTPSSLILLCVCAWLTCLHGWAGTYKNITIDGSFGDWVGVPILFTGPTNSNPSVVDYKDIYVANDENYLYIRFTLYQPDNPFTSLQNIFIDADNNGLTGFGAGGYVGSEMLIQGGVGYQEKNGGFNEGGINGLNWAAAPAGSGTDFELRISRAATYATDSLPVFISDTIAFVLEAEISYVPTEWAPAQIGGLTYTFEPPPTPLTTNLTLLTLNSTWQFNSSGTDLGTAWQDPSYDDSAWGTGSGLFGYTGSPGSYPPINTTLPSGPNTYYFRTHFNWNFLAANVALVATNYLSDGSVIYLNGQEVRRVRMPSGVIGYSTSATGAASPVGRADVFGISGQSLVLGDNVLEVETHQAPGTSSDMVFGLSLTAAAQFAPFNVATNLPADQNVVAGQPVTLSADVIGSGPLGFQWSKNGAPIAGATAENYSLPVVLTNDAGNYVLVTTNALGTNTTRTAVLTVTSTPVTFNDPTQPADAYTLEAQPVTLAVSVSGSPVYQFQWFKNNNPITDATNAAYTLSNPVLTDSGSYRVTVTNPSGSTNSRTAVLTVLPDNLPPSIVAVTASANSLLLTFSALLDPATANSAIHYSLSGGISISSAALSLANPTQVTLTTSSALSLGIVYRLTINGVTDLRGNADHQTVSVTRTIIIDGSFDDWQGVPAVYTGPIGNPDAADFKEIYLYNDDSNYYGRVVLWHDIPPEAGQFPFFVNMFFDTDNNAATGYSVFGSEFLIQSGFGYQEKNGGFNEGGLNNLNWVSLPAAPGTNFEFSISRATSYASDNLPVFTTNILNFVWQGMNTGFIPQNTVPASGVLSYTNVPSVTVPPLAFGFLSIQTAPGGKLALAWETAGTLQARGSLTSGTWTNVPSAQSPYVIPVNGAQAYFRLSN